MKKIIVLMLMFIFTILSSGLNVTIAKSSEINLNNFYVAPVTQTDGKVKWGYINEVGKFVISPKYDIVNDFNDKGIAIVANGENKGLKCTVYFINKNGSVVEGPFICPVPDYHNNVAIVHDENKGSIVINDEGKVLLNSKNYLYEYDEGLFNFSVTVGDKKNCYGYMNIKGDVVVPAKYSNAYAFNNGTALVELSGNGYELIDKSGKVIKRYTQFPTTGSYSEGLKVFYDQKSKKYGYKDTEGNIVIKPIYDYAELFKDGVAKVSITDKNTNVEKLGLINKLGQYVLKPIYSGIEYLGEGRVAVSKNSDGVYNYATTKKAIYDIDGNQVTGFDYYSISNYKDGAASVCDDTNTFLIDSAGKLIKDLPKLKGVGLISYTNNLIKADIDDKIQYFNKGGSLVWSEDETYSLGNGVKVIKERYRADYAKYIEYPQLIGIKNTSVETKINNFIKAIYLKNSAKTAKQNGVYTETSEIKFTLEKNKNLLVLGCLGYVYPIGAVHGISSREYYHIDITSGDVYSLNDLFLSKADYTKVVTNFVKSQVIRIKKINKVVSYNDFFENDIKISKATKFILGKESLKIYYDLYEIAPYAAGFPEFEIPYGQLRNIINTKGKLWNSFDKNMSNNKPNVITNLDSATKNTLINLMQNYEKSMVAAINTNDFNKVKINIAVNSPLYKNQMSRISSFFKKGIKEIFKNCEIYAVINDPEKNQYYIFVNEGISIKDNGKKFLDRYFNFCYISEKDTNTNQYKLVDVVKW